MIYAVSDPYYQNFFSALKETTKRKNSNNKDRKAKLKMKIRIMNIKIHYTAGWSAFVHQQQKVPACVELNIKWPIGKRTCVVKLPNKTMLGWGYGAFDDTFRLLLDGIVQWFSNGQQKWFSYEKNRVSWQRTS